MDLPETLTYASYFIAYNFPDKRIGYLSDIIDRLDNFNKLLEEFDFLIIPTWVSDYIPDSKVDLGNSIHTPLGEMSKRVVGVFT